jgi:hypothetical protein
MAFDPSVISAIADYGPHPVAAEEKALGIKESLDRVQLGRLQLGEEKRKVGEQAEVDKILKRSDYSTPEGLAKTAAEVNRVSPRAAMDLLKTGQAYQSGQIQQQLDQLTLAEKRQDLIVGGIDGIVGQARAMKNQGASDLAVNAFIQQQLPGALQQLRGMTLSDGKPALPDDVLKMVSTTKPTLQALEGWEARSKQGAAAIKQRLEQFKADTQAQHANEHVETIMVGGKPHRVLYNAEGKQIRDLGETQATAAGGAAQAMRDPTNRALLGALAAASVTLPAGFRNQATQTAMLEGLRERWEHENPNGPTDPFEKADAIAADVKSGKLKLTAETKAAAVAGGQIGKVALAGRELEKFGDQTLEASAKVPRGIWGEGKNLTINGLIQAGERQFSDPNLLRLKAKLTALNNAYDQLAARGGTDQDKRAHIHELFDARLSEDAVKVLVQSLKEEAAGAREAATETVGEVSGRSIPGIQAGGTKKGESYQHPSGATVTIVEE